MLYSQSMALLDNFDEEYLPYNSYISQYEQSVFFSSSLGGAKISLDNFDQELLNASIYFTLNKERNNKNKTSVVYAEALDVLAYSAVNFYASSVFKKGARGQERLERVFYIASREIEIDHHYLTAAVAYVPMLNVERNKKIHYVEEDHRSSFRLYYRNKDHKDKKPEEIVESYSYNELASVIVYELQKGVMRSILYSRSISTGACYAKIDPNTLSRSKGPFLKVMFVIGGKRLVDNE